MLKTTECTEAHFQEAEHKRYQVMSHYSTQELEDLLMASSKGHSLEFLSHFSNFKAGLLSEIQESTINNNNNVKASINPVFLFFEIKYRFLLEYIGTITKVCYVVKKVKISMLKNNMNAHTLLKKLGTALLGNH